MPTDLCSPVSRCLAWLAAIFRSHLADSSWHCSRATFSLCCDEIVSVSCWCSIERCWSFLSACRNNTTAINRHIQIRYNTIRYNTIRYNTDTHGEKPLLNQPIYTVTHGGKSLLNQPIYTDKHGGKSLLNQPIYTDTHGEKSLLNQPIYTDTHGKKSLVFTLIGIYELAISPHNKADPADSSIELWQHQHGPVSVDSQKVFRTKVGNFAKWMDTNAKLFAFQHKAKISCDIIV